MEVLWSIFRFRYSTLRRVLGLILYFSLNASHIFFRDRNWIQQKKLLSSPSDGNFRKWQSFWKEKESIITCILKKYIYVLYKINHKSNMTICMTGHTFTSRCQLQIWYFSRAGHPCHRRRECVFFASRQGGSDAKNVFLEGWLIPDIIKVSNV